MRNLFGYGLSWGFAGIRIGRSQYGTWWISIGLPFGFRINKRLGRNKDGVSSAGTQCGGSQTSVTVKKARTIEPPPSPRIPENNSISKNKEILEKMLRKN